MPSDDSLGKKTNLIYSVKEERYVRNLTIAVVSVALRVKQTRTLSVKHPLHDICFFLWRLLIFI